MHACSKYRDESKKSGFWRWNGGNIGVATKHLEEAEAAHTAETAAFARLQHQARVFDCADETEASAAVLVCSECVRERV